MKKVIFSFNNRLTHLENALSSKITLNRRKYLHVMTKIRLSSADIQTNVYSDMRLIWKMNAVSEAGKHTCSAHLSLTISTLHNRLHCF